MFVFAKLRGMEVYERVLVGRSIVAMEEDVGAGSRNDSATADQPWSFLVVGNISGGREIGQESV